MTDYDTVDVYYYDDGDRYHYEKDCPRLSDVADEEVKQTVVYGSRRIGDPNAISDKQGCPDCHYR